MAKSSLPSPPYEEPRDKRFPEHFESETKHYYHQQDIKRNDEDYYDHAAYRRITKQFQDLTVETGVGVYFSIYRAVLPGQDDEERTTDDESYQELEARVSMSSPFFLVTFWTGDEHRWHEVHHRIIALIDENYGGLEIFQPRIVRYANRPAVIRTGTWEAYD